MGTAVWSRNSYIQTGDFWAAIRAEMLTPLHEKVLSVAAAAAAKLGWRTGSSPKRLRG